MRTEERKVALKKPGREMDAEVAEEVLGWHRCRQPCCKNRMITLTDTENHVTYIGKKVKEFQKVRELPHFSTDIDDAMKVVDATTKPNNLGMGGFWQFSNHGHLWTASYVFRKHTYAKRVEKLPHAICLLALRIHRIGS